MDFLENTELRIVRTGDGAVHRQHRFFCPVHGWFDLFVFPNAALEHATCGEEMKPAGAGLELPKVTAKAA